MIVWDHWHIEPSSICTLKCPRCPRAEVPQGLLNRQLSLDFFQNQLGVDVIKKIRKITFCGNDGDPIYCRDLIAICEWIKVHNPELQLVIVTNGSHKSQAWWSQLAGVLNRHDEIHWSLDGWDQSSNELYRFNCDWSSIMDGYTTFAEQNNDTYRVWACIAFLFNQDHLPQMQSMARDMQFDLFQITKSTKFGSHYPDTYGLSDPLCPTRKDLVSSSHRFERQWFQLSHKIRPGAALQQVFLSRAQRLQNEQQYSALCMIGNKGVFLNSQGHFFPCCWTATRYAHNQSWTELAAEKFDLTKRNFQTIMQDDFWTTEFLRFNSLECQTKCTKEKLSDHEHTTQW